MKFCHDEILKSCPKINLAKFCVANVSSGIVRVHKMNAGEAVLVLSKAYSMIFSTGGGGGMGVKKMLA